MIDADILTAAKSVGTQMRVRDLSDAEISAAVDIACQAFDRENDRALIDQLGRWLGGILQAIQREEQPAADMLSAIAARIGK